MAQRKRLLEAVLGDLVFFTGTYQDKFITNMVIYVLDGCIIVMIAASNTLILKGILA